MVWPARARQVSMPALRDRPALDPHDCSCKPKDKIDRDDDEPDEPPDPDAARNAQERDGEGRLAPCCSQKGTEACADGDPAIGRHLLRVQVTKVHADAVLGAFGQQCRGNEDGKLLHVGRD